MHDAYQRRALEQVPIGGTARPLAPATRVSGTERKGRNRDVPLIWRPAVPQLHRRTFENKVRERCPDMEARDLRKTYATGMEDAGIPRTRRRMYLGHGTKDVTDLYERQEIAAFLVEDAERLRQFLGLSQEKSHELRVQKRNSA